MLNKRLLGLLAFPLLSAIGARAQDSLPAARTGSLPDTSHPVNWLYGTRNPSKITAALSEVRTPVLVKTNTSTFGGWLSGRVAGLHSFQPGGEPGNDDVNLFIRGQAAPLVLVDGTPQSFPSINPEQIESITVLKDAVATSMLGMRGGNGAILITTKKGVRAPGQQISFQALYGVQQPTRLPRFVRAYDYARLYNEALANEGQAPAYSAADLEAYRTGSDPIGHPDVDWQEELLRKQAPYSRYDLAISGGSRASRYFVNLDYLNQQGLLKEAAFNKYSTNSEYKRYIIRSNVEVDLTEALTTSLNLFGRIQNTNSPGAGTASIFSGFRNTPNGAYPKLNSDSSLGGNLDYQNNLYGQSVLSGYQDLYERDFKADLALKLRLDRIARGLWVRGLAAINAYQRENTNRSKTFAVFRQTENAGVKNYTRYGTTGNQSNAQTITSQNRLFYAELSAGWAKQLDARNGLEALVLASNDYRMVNSDLPFNYTTIASRISYDHADKYFVDLTAGYNGTERFPKGKRFGFFPALGLGWNLAKEAFLQPTAGWLNALKLRASYGKTGNANVGYYDYYQYYTTGSGYGFGNTVPSSTTTLQQGALANPHITFEKAAKFNAGIDARLLKNRLSLTVDYFNDHYYDLVQSRNDGSDILGTGYVAENLGKNRFYGWEFTAAWRKEGSGLTYFLAPNLTIQQSKAEYLAEPRRNFAYQAQTGRPVGAAYGYVADGLFQSPAEIAAHAFQGPGIQPGDIRYRDLNGDGLINADDQQVIGNTRPFIYYGLHTGLGYGGFALEVLFQGVGNANYNVAGYRAFQNNGRGQVYAEQLNYWRPDNPNADYPRLWLGNNANNTLTSTYWIREVSYLRLKNVELSYTLPAAWLRKAHLGGMRLFVNGTNLLTFSSLNDQNIDPETGAGAYPVMKTLVAGIHLNF